MSHDKYELLDIAGFVEEHTLIDVVLHQFTYFKRPRHSGADRRERTPYRSRWLPLLRNLCSDNITIVLLTFFRGSPLLAGVTTDLFCKPQYDEG
ncbi:MAG TPA: hypothetical protein VEK33_09320 [Terriglobales bacterium]|nr:hypothetical protein [Terriglobales bacterium]